MNKKNKSNLTNDFTASKNKLLYQNNNNKITQKRLFVKLIFLY